MPITASSHLGSPDYPSCSALAWYSCWPGLFPWGGFGKRTPVARTTGVTRYRYDTQPTFLNENISTSIKISLKFVHKGRINNIPALIQILAWDRPGGKPLSEPMVSLQTHVCATRPQSVHPMRDDDKNLRCFARFTPQFYTALGDNGKIRVRRLYSEHEIACKKIW